MEDVEWVENQLWCIAKFIQVDTHQLQVKVCKLHRVLLAEVTGGRVFVCEIQDEHSRATEQQESI